MTDLDTTARRARSLLLGGAAEAYGFNPGSSVVCGRCSTRFSDHESECPGCGLDAEEATSYSGPRLRSVPLSEILAHPTTSLAAKDYVYPDADTTAGSPDHNRKV